MNSRFFHASILVHRRRNMILALKEDGKWFYEKYRIEGLLVRKFQNLYSSEIHDSSYGIRQLVEECIDSNENAIIIKIPSNESEAGCLGSSSIEES